MEFEWDERKRQINLEKHEIDFEDAMEMWQGDVLDLPSARQTGEERHVAIGLLQGRLVAVIYTWRSGERRLISARRTRSHERADYQKTFGRGR